jgi:AraC-like DNA-binding protein
MQRAEQLLETSELPVKQIAALSGFESVANFIRRFRNRTGHTPGTYRLRRLVRSTGENP